MAYNFEVGKQYRRRDVYRVIGISEDTKGGNWDTGYSRHGDDWFIFCNIGTPGRTGHDYQNAWLGEDLLWFGKTHTTLSQPAIQSMLKPKGYIYIFTRTDSSSPFNFAGFGKAAEHKNTSPVTIRWELLNEPG
jgi:5-methylcytosine-specific restriction protein A